MNSATETIITKSLLPEGSLESQAPAPPLRPISKESLVQIDKFIDLFFMPAAQLAEAEGIERGTACFAMSLRKLQGHYETRFCNLLPGASGYIRTIAESWALHKAKGYFNLGYRNGHLGKGKRGRGDQVMGKPGLWADLDIGAVGHAEKKLPQSIEEAMDLISDALPDHPPTHYVSSGYGLHVYWIHDKPWYFKDSDDWARAQGQLCGLDARIRAAAQRKGFKLDNVSDMARVLRVPGTYNMKDPANPKLVQFIYEGKHRYQPEDMDFLAEEHAKANPEKSPRRAPVMVKASASDKAPATPKAGGAGGQNSKHYEETPVNFERITKECAFMRHWVNDADGLPEPEWFAGISIAARCVDGPAIVHQYSAVDRRYTAGETEAKIHHALQNAGPRTCANIFQGLGFDQCEQCVYRRHITSPIQLGYIRGATHAGA